MPAAFYSELNDFPNGRHDDLLDSASGSIHSLRGDVLMMNGASVIPTKLNVIKETSFNTQTSLSRF